MEQQVKISVVTNNELRADLMNVYNELRNGEINKGTAKEIANVAGKILSSAKTQLDYNKWVKNESKIDFFE